MRRPTAALVFWLALATGPAPGVAEPESDPEPTAIVTLDALPLGIPFEALSPAARERTEGVLARSLFGQRVSGLRFRSREAIFRFLLDHPDFAASLARALRFGEYRVTPREDGYWGDDARGAEGVIRVLYADDGRRLFHLEGRYRRKALPTIVGELLVLLEFRHAEDAAGGTVVDSSLTGHLRVDTPIAGLLGSTVGALARPLVEQAVERKVRRFFRTVARLSRWAHDEPEHLWSAIEGHAEVPSGPLLDAFRAILLDGLTPAWADAICSQGSSAPLPIPPPGRGVAGEARAWNGTPSVGGHSCRVAPGDSDRLPDQDP